MVVNTETLIHFTSDLQKLLSILEGDFLPQMSLEDFSYISKFEDRQKAAIPICCFCDIPLHLVGDHMSEYGQYGIGLSKEWGIKVGLNPVVYVKKNSALFRSIYNIKEHLFYTSNGKGKFTTQDRMVWELLTFLKPYEGTSHKNGRRKIFYDECEWRYSPGIYNIYRNKKILPILFESKFSTHREQLNTILRDFPLRYHPSDIKYIIVPAETEILPVIKAIDRIKMTKYSQDELDVLKSKIIPAKYMLEDF